jgi:hypothetical protein
MGRFDLSRKIEALDPRQDHQKIVFLVGTQEFPFEVQRALEFALVRTFAVPRMSAVLDKSGEMTQRGQKRYDDTSLIIAEIAENGYDSERGRAALRRMNQMHSRYPILNEDFIYVLSTFIFEPIRWNRLLAWRRYTETERLANFYFWCEVGRRMNIRDLPETYEALEAFSRDYEKRNFTFAESNQRVANGAVNTFLGWLPKPMRPLGRRAIYALIDEPMRIALGYPKQPAWLTWALKRGFRLRALAVRLMPPRRKPYLYTQERSRSYPNGYSIEQLGPKQTP